MDSRKTLTRGSTTALVLAISALIVSFAACEPTGPIKIGFVGGLTGRHYNLGISGRNGVTLALEEANAQGGVNGRRIELIVKDDKQDKAEAVRVVEELIAEKVPVVIGHMTSAMSEATLPIVNARGVLMVSPTTSSSFFAGKDDSFIMLHPSTAIGAGILAAYVREKRAIRTVAIVYDLSNKAYTASWHDNFKREFEQRGGAVVSSLTFTSGEKTSFLDLAASALQERPQAILVVANALDTALICQQVRKLDTGVQILGTEWAFTADILKHGGRTIEGVVFIEKVNIKSEAPAYVAFRDNYRKRFEQDPDFAAVLGYDAFRVVQEALKQDPSGKDLKRAILGIGKFAGLQGPFEIDANGDAARRHYIMTVRDNDFALVE